MSEHLREMRDLYDYKVASIYKKRSCENSFNVEHFCDKVLNT